MELEPGTERPQGRQYVVAAVIIALLAALAYWGRARGWLG